MTDPVTGAGASSAQKIAENAASSGVEEAAGEGGASFDEVLDQVQESASAGATEGATEKEAVSGIDAAEQVQEVDGPAKTRLDDFINQINGDQQEIQSMLDRGMSGADMSQKDLLQVQALIYGHAQRVELTTKVVSNATKGVKQVMNTQV